MAYTMTKVLDTVVGDQRMRVFDVTADATTQAMATGLQYINAFHIQCLSMTTTTVPKCAANVTASGAAANGSVAITTAVSGDHFFLTVFGR